MFKAQRPLKTELYPLSLQLVRWGRWHRGHQVNPADTQDNTSEIQPVVPKTPFLCSFTPLAVFMASDASAEHLRGDVIYSRSVLLAITKQNLQVIKCLLPWQLVQPGHLQLAQHHPHTEREDAKTHFSYTSDSVQVCSCRSDYSEGAISVISERLICSDSETRSTYETINV